MQKEPQPKRKTGLRKYQNQIVLGLFSILAIYIGLLLLAENQGYLGQSDGLSEYLRSFTWWLLLPVIGCQLLVIFFRFVEWHYYLGVIGARDKISLLDSAVIFVSMFTMVVSPGKAAEVLKAVFLKAKTGIPIARSAPIVIAERIVDGLAVIVIMAVTLLVAGDQLNLGTYNGVDYDLLSRTIIFSSSGLIVFGLIVVQIEPLAYFFLHLLQRLPFLGRLYAPLVEFYESSREIFRLQHVIPMTLVGVCVYVPSALGFLLILAGLGLDITWQLFLQTTFIVGVSSAIGALSFVPNGAGVTELSNVGMLLALVAPINPLVTPALAATAALLQGFFHKWFRVVVGMAVGIAFRKRLFSDDLENILAELESEDQQKLAPRVESQLST